MNKAIVNALRAYYIGEIEKTKANVNIFLESSVGVGEHPDVLESVSYTHLTLPTKRIV